MNGKEQVALEIAKRVTDGQLIGVGTGSTVELAIRNIGQRIKTEGLRLNVVPTSMQTAWLCQEMGMHVLYQGFRGELAWGFDGADVVDDRLRAIKGKGGAMLQEKILAARCREFVLLIDESKLVSDIAVCPIPVEVITSAVGVVERGLKRLGATSQEIRMAQRKHGPVITEGGNVIIDAKFEEVPDNLEDRLKSIVGVVESGLFTKLATQVLVGGADKVIRMKQSG